MMKKIEPTLAISIYLTGDNLEAIHQGDIQAFIGSLGVVNETRFHRKSARRPKSVEAKISFYHSAKGIKDGDMISIKGSKLRVNFPKPIVILGVDGLNDETVMKKAILINGIVPSIQKAAIQAAFSSFGKTITGTGYKAYGGIVLFFETEAAVKACLAAGPNHKVQGRIVECQQYKKLGLDELLQKVAEAKSEKSQVIKKSGHRKKEKEEELKEKPEDAGVSSVFPSSSLPKREERKKRVKGYRVKAFGVSYHATEAIIHSYFSKYGKVIRIMYPMLNDKPRGYCTVYMESLEAAHAICNEAAKHEILGKPITCKLGRLRESEAKNSVEGLAGLSSIGVPPSLVVPQYPQPVAPLSLFPPAPPPPAPHINPVLEQSVAIPAQPVQQSQVIPPAIPGASSVAIGSEELKGSSSDDRIAMLKEQIKDYEDMLDTYICPISFQLMKDPVNAEDGQTYERRNIEDWMKKSSVSPITGGALVTKALVPNVKARQTISEICEKISKCQMKLLDLKKK